jgi:hypothetical protein
MEKYSTEVANLNTENREVRKLGSQDARKPFYLNIPNCCDIINFSKAGKHVILIPYIRHGVICDTLR